MKRIKPQHFLILLLVAAIAAAPFLCLLYTSPSPRDS